MDEENKKIPFYHSKTGKMYNINIKKSIYDLDTCIENMRSEGLDNKTIALNLATASALVKTKKWDNFYLDIKKEKR